MTHYALICTDQPNSLELRMATREAHLAYMKSLGSKIVFGGPFLTEADQMAGSLVIVEAEDKAAAETISLEDPYRKAGLFASVEIRRIRVPPTLP